MHFWNNRNRNRKLKRWNKWNHMRGKDIIRSFEYDTNIFIWFNWRRWDNFKGQYQRLQKYIYGGAVVSTGAISGTTITGTGNLNVGSNYVMCGGVTCSNSISCWGVSSSGAISGTTFTA